MQNKETTTLSQEEQELRKEIITLLVIHRGEGADSEALLKEATTFLEWIQH